MIRRYLAYRPSETARIYRMLTSISRGVQGHGPIHLSLASAAKIGFIWNLDECNWVRPGLGALHLISSPWQVFFSKPPFYRLGKIVFLLSSVKGKVFEAFRTVFLCLTGRAL